MKKPLKQAVQEQINALSLDEQRIEKLMQMQREDALLPKIEPSRQMSNNRWYSFVAVAAMLLVFVLVTVVVSLRTTEPTQISSGMIQKIANEVAGNHLKMKPMEVQTAAIGDVQRYFTELDFLPQQSQYIDGMTHIKLAGGRYCSIQGSTAAQLRYKDKDGGYVTLFQTYYSPELFDNPELLKQLPDVDKSEQPIVTYARGIKVTIWVEHGLLMVSTEKP